LWRAPRGKVTGKKGGRVPRPPTPGDWTLRFLKGSVSDDWDKLCAQEVGTARASYDHMAKMPRARGARSWRVALSPPTARSASRPMVPPPG